MKELHCGTRVLCEKYISWWKKSLLKTRKFKSSFEEKKEIQVGLIAPDVHGNRIILIFKWIKEIQRNQRNKTRVLESSDGKFLNF